MKQIIIIAALLSAPAFAQNSTGTSAVPSSNTGSVIPDPATTNGAATGISKPTSATGSTSSPNANNSAINTNRIESQAGQVGSNQMSSADFDLGRRVRADLGNMSGAAAQNVIVTSKNGIVTLTGTVNSTSDAALVESRARASSGVTQVINQLQVNSAVR